MSEKPKVTKICIDIQLSNGAHRMISYENKKNVQNLIHKLAKITTNEEVKKYLEDINNYCILCQKYSDLICLECKMTVCDKCYSNHHH
jgi:hypothetical protein